MASPSIFGASASQVASEQICSRIESPHLPFRIRTTPRNWRFMAAKTINCCSLCQLQRRRRFRATLVKYPFTTSEKYARRLESNYWLTTARQCLLKPEDSTTSLAFRGDGPFNAKASERNYRKA